MFAQPIRQFLFAERPCRQGEHRANGIVGCEAERRSIERQEQARKHPGGAFIAVDEWVVAGDAVGRSGGEGAAVVFAMVPAVHRPSEGGIQQPRIAHARSAAVLGKLAVVDGQGDMKVEPERLGAIIHANALCPGLIAPACEGCRGRCA